MTLEEVNGLSIADFTEAFGDIAEHSPWVARHAASARPFASREAMVAAFAGSLKAAKRESQLALIRAHPDLATKAKITEDTTREQAGAGLDSLSADELARFTHLNELYKSKFDFPFIFAVKGATKQQILARFAERIGNTPEDEFALAIEQICRIFRFRIEERVAA
ncbi:MAG: 2-oxo-4-hydroxy-4-carboxy-5-ureidoimidazoline decarboxylase [Rhizobiales bacterium]|nr:2-oxo-4-hydroxy-4-carboxy-5-ureidoimidazoline decarboxylase [Hyphomicrobiales bacterium]